MKVKDTLAVVLFLLAAGSGGCSDDATAPDSGDSAALDAELLALVNTASNGLGTGFFLLPDATDLQSIPQDPLNPLTTEKVALGRLLVHETATGGAPKTASTLYTYSCASCHPVAAGFFAGLRQGIGEGGSGFGVAGEGRVIMPDNVVPRDSLDVLPIKVPTLLNIAYQEVALWNGALGGTGINAPFVAQNAVDLPDNLLGFEGPEVQGMAGQVVHRLKIDEEFAATFGYIAMFDAAFPNIAATERYSRVTGGLAIAAFNRTVLANEAPWQKWLAGDYDALTDQQKEGALAFLGNGQCSECHTGPALKALEFHAFGMGDFDPQRTIILDRKAFKKNEKLGRGGFTGIAEDEYKFKTPTLYNLIDNRHYGHGGTFTTVRAVVEYKNNGVKQNDRVPDGRLAEQFGTTNLTATEITQLVDFLENALYDPNLARYVPASVLSGNCIPNNDAQSKIDLGCD